MNLSINLSGGQIVTVVLGQQMAPVAGGIEQDIFRAGFDGTVQDRLKRLVATVLRLKSQIVTEQHEAPGLSGK